MPENTTHVLDLPCVSFKRDMRCAILIFAP